MKKYLIGVSISLFALASNAKDMSAQKLLELSKGNQTEVGASIGYVLGVLDANNGRLFCISNSVNRRDLVENTLKGIDDASKKHGDLSDVSASLILTTSFTQFAPCKSNQTGSKLL